MQHTPPPRAVLGPIALLLLLACNSPLANDGEGPTTGDFTLELVPATGIYSRDEEAVLQLRNRSDEDLGYGACSLLLERRTASGWRRVTPKPEYCILILYVVRSGGAAEFPVDFSSFDRGTYRYRMVVMPGTNIPEITIISPEFVVLP